MYICLIKKGRWKVRISISCCSWLGGVLDLHNDHDYTLHVLFLPGVYLENEDSSPLTLTAFFLSLRGDAGAKNIS